VKGKYRIPRKNEVKVDGSAVAVKPYVGGKEARREGKAIPTKFPSKRAEPKNQQKKTKPLQNGRRSHT